MTSSRVVRHLPPPSGGRVSHIVHIADTHIRSGGVSVSRFDEYAAVFDALLAQVASLPSVRDGTAVACILGDVFHSKGRIEPPGIALFNRLVGGLAALCPVFVVRGNHDYRQCTEHIDRSHDLIASLLASSALPNVAYLDVTGSYRCADVGFGIVTIQDALDPSSPSGYLDVLPDFPAASDLDDGCRFKVGLFHGPVSNSSCRLPNGRVIGGGGG